MINLTHAALSRGFPRAPAALLSAFVANVAELDRAGILHKRQRLLFFLSNVDHECSGFALGGLAENINYSAERMAKVWPNRFADAAIVRARFGSASGWQRRAFDEIYGNRMGNRPGSSDGSTYIGRGGVQLTGRGAYAEIGRRINVDLVNEPLRASDPQLQPALCAAFWSWKDMNSLADADDFLACVKRWNGGHNGLADRKRCLAKWSRLL